MRNQGADRDTWTTRWVTATSRGGEAGKRRWENGARCKCAPLAQSNPAPPPAGAGERGRGSSLGPVEEHTNGEGVRSIRGARATHNRGSRCERQDQAWVGRCTKPAVRAIRVAGGQSAHRRETHVIPSPSRVPLARTRGGGNTRRTGVRHATPGHQVSDHHEARRGREDAVRPPVTPSANSGSVSLRGRPHAGPVPHALRNTPSAPFAGKGAQGPARKVTPKECRWRERAWPGRRTRTSHSRGSGRITSQRGPSGRVHRARGRGHPGGGSRSAPREGPRHRGHQGSVPAQPRGGGNTRWTGVRRATPGHQASDHREARRGGRPRRRPSGTKGSLQLLQSPRHATPKAQPASAAPRASAPMRPPKTPGPAQ